MRTRKVTTTYFALSLVAVAFVPLPVVEAQSKDSGKHLEAAALFKRRCQSCHAVPDPEQAQDAAWLDQVNRTA